MATALDPFSGEETFAVPPSRVFDVLTDLDALSAAMPGLVSAERVDERTLKAVVRPGLSFMTGRVRLTLVLAEARPGEQATMHVAAASIGVGLSIDAALSLSPLYDGRRTHLAWEARVHDMKGLMSAVPAGLVRAAADKVITDGWQSLRPRIEG